MGAWVLINAPWYKTRVGNNAVPPQRHHLMMVGLDAAVRLASADSLRERVANISDRVVICGARAHVDALVGLSQWQPRRHVMRNFLDDRWKAYGR